SAAIPSLFELLKTEQNEEILLIVLELLNNLTRSKLERKYHWGDREVETLKRLTHHEEPEIRHRAHLLMLQTKPVADVLIKGMFDPYPPVQQISIAGLFSDFSQSEAVLKIALEKRNSELAWERTAAVEWLTLANRRQADLPQALRDPEPIVRQKSAALMGKLPQADFERPLIAALADEDPKVRELAARSLSSYDSPEAYEGLL